MPGWWVVCGFSAAALCCLAVAGAAWRRRSVGDPTRLLAATAAAAALWSLAVPAQFLAPTQGLREVARGVYLLAVHGSLVSLFMVCRSVADPSWHPTRAGTLRLVALPAALVVALATNRRHGWFYADPVVSRTPLGPDPGPLVVVNTLVVFAFFGAALLVLGLGRRRAVPFFRARMTVLALAALPPALLGVVTVLGRDALGGLDLAPLGFVVTAAVTARTVFRLGWMRVVPIAREQVLDRLTDAVVVVDPAGVLVDLNTPGEVLARRLRPGLPAELVGRDVADVLWPQVLAVLAGTGEVRATASPLPGVHLDAQVDDILDGSGRRQGRVVVLRDVSDLVSRREELRELNEQLSRQLHLNETLRERLADDAVRDPLTGLHNRRRLGPSLLRAVEQARATGGAVSVVVVDVDRFKTVNDTHGHAAGDEVLVAVADALAAGCGPSDGLVRLGGEEFVLVLPRTGAPGVAVRAEDARRACADLAVPVPGGRVRVTVSAGTATFPGDGATGEDLLAAADAALYVAKATGRDRVVAASPRQAPTLPLLPRDRGSLNP